MRWDALRTNAPADGQPGAPSAPMLFEHGAVTRTFDTPAFRGMTFFEIQARSIINRVPDASRVPFRWTINPYRGCSHSCVYCAGGETPILMADGRTKPLAEVRTGDAIYGTIRQGSYRRYVPTTVLAQWETVKPGYLVSLEDGTQLVASGDHRFLTGRGWKYVTGAEQGAARRPHLTVNNKLMGVGAFAEPPKGSPDYRRGYLCGMIRGDATIGDYDYERSGGGGGHVSVFRLALADQEGLDRTRGYLARAGIHCAEFTFAEPTATRRRMTAIRTQRRDEVRVIQYLIRWPGSPSADWQKGFLAGIFDAEGSYSCGILRISNTDRAIIGWTTSCLASLGFGVAAEPSNLPNGLTYLRLRGGLREALRFFHTTDPAITRKRTIDGVAIKSDAKLTVTSVEPLGLDMPMFDITTGTGDFIANGVVSHNCFARKSHTYLDFDAGHDFDSKIVVKVNAPELARKELAAPRWRGEHIAMGTNVDCYQRAEGRYRLMPGILTALRDAANPFSILTKGTLILRDLELICQAADVTDVGLAVSVGCADEALWRDLEPGTPSPRRRLEVCAAFAAAGLPCAVLMGPIVPFLSDSPERLDATVRQIAAAGAASVTPIVLHLRPGAREWYLRWLGERHPGLLPRYRGLYGRGAYASAAYQRQVTERVQALARKYRVGAGAPRPRRHARPPSAFRGQRRPGEAAAAGPAATAPAQLTLL
jgi:DNA repair photolyase